MWYVVKPLLRRPLMPLLIVLQIAVACAIACNAETMVENLLVVAAGVVLGLLAAYGINLWLMRHYELLRLPWTYLPIGAVLLLALGQLAALSPALRAARVPPAVATRSV